MFVWNLERWPPTQPILSERPLWRRQSFKSTAEVIPAGSATVRACACGRPSRSPETWACGLGKMARMTILGPLGSEWLPSSSEKWLAWRHHGPVKVITSVHPHTACLLTSIMGPESHKFFLATYAHRNSAFYSVLEVPDRAKAFSDSLKVWQCLSIVFL